MEYTDVKHNLRTAYDRHADQRNAMSDQWRKPRERDRFAHALADAGATSLIEIGAGHGVSGRFFADAGFQVVCTDLSPEGVGALRGRQLHPDPTGRRQLGLSGPHSPTPPTDIHRLTSAALRP